MRQAATAWPKLVLPTNCALKGITGHGGGQASRLGGRGFDVLEPRYQLGMSGAWGDESGKAAWMSEPYRGLGGVSPCWQSWLLAVAAKIILRIDMLGGCDLFL